MTSDTASAPIQPTTQEIFSAISEEIMYMSIVMPAIIERLEEKAGEQGLSPAAVGHHILNDLRSRLDRIRESF